MKTLSDKYQLIKEGKINKKDFERILFVSLGLLYSNLQIWWVKKRIKLGL